MALSQKYINRLVADVVHFRRKIASLEADEIYLGERNAGGKWLASNRRWINHLKRTIKDFEGVLAKARPQS
jgi:hypothetical protein